MSVEQNTQRGKLIDLIVNAKKACPETESFTEFLADFLIGYGVIVPDDTYELDRLRDLVQADRDGRCVVLSEPMVPMVQRPGDTDVYCPNCGNTISGGWKLSEVDDCRKMCQCPHCGQAIDDTKCAVYENEKKGQS